MSKILSTAYVVDQRNFIVELDSQWDRLLETEEWASDLAREKVLGRYLGDFVSDDNTLMYLEASLTICRLKNQILYRPYRCDSVTHKQFMELELTPLDNKCVRMTHYLLRQERFEQAIPLTWQAPQAVPLAKTILRCSMCNRIFHKASGQWQEPEVYFDQHSTELKVIHTVCPECKTRVWNIRRPDQI